MKKFFSLVAAVLMAVNVMALEEIAVATFNGKGGVYTEGWTTTGTGASRTDCVIIGADENITSPEFDLTEYSEVYVAFSGRRYGSLSGSKATVNVAVNGTSVGSINITASSVGVVTDTLMFTPTADMTNATFVFTCSNATSAGSTHGAGIGQITILGEEGSETGGGIIEEEHTIVGELLCTLDFPSHNDAEISSYTDTWTATVNGETWTLTAFNNNKNVWNLVKCGRKGVASVASIETPALKATVNTLIYDFAALPANSVDSAFIYALYQGAEQAKAPVTLKAGKDTIAAPVAGVKYSYKLEIYCKSASSNGPVQLSTVQVYGTPAQSAVEDPTFSLAAGEFYDAQKVALACATEGAQIYYTLDGSEPDPENSTLYTDSIEISTTTTVKAIAIKNNDGSDVVSKTYTIAPRYASLTELINEAGAPAGQKVVVTLTNETIDSLYVTKAGKRNGIYLTAAGRMVEIYCYDVPATWEVGGTVSGTVKGEWKNFNGTWEVCPSTWNDLEYTAPAGGWDGTVTLSKESFAALSELEGLTLTFNGATTLALLDAEGSMIALQNEDGSEMYAMWAPAYGGTYTIDGAVVTLSDWYAADGETDPLPAASAILYIEDYGSFIVDGDDEAYFETAEIAYEAAPATTYTVTYTVNGLDPEHCLVQAGYYNATESVGDTLAAGANTVPGNVKVYVSAIVVDGYTVEVKVNGEVVTLTDSYWETSDFITADMTIVVTFTSPTTAVEAVKDVKATKALVDGQVVVIRNGVRYNVAGKVIK